MAFAGQHVRRRLQGGWLFIVAQSLAWSLFAGGSAGALLATYAAREAGGPPPLWAVAVLGTAAMVAPFALSSSAFAFDRSQGAEASAALWAAKHQCHVSGPHSAASNAALAAGAPSTSPRQSHAAGALQDGGQASTVSAPSSPRQSRSRCKSPRGARRHHGHHHFGHGPHHPHKHRRRRRHAMPECTCSADSLACTVHGVARHSWILRMINMCARNLPSASVQSACADNASDLDFLLASQEQSLAGCNQ